MVILIRASFCWKWSIHPSRLAILHSVQLGSSSQRLAWVWGGRGHSGDCCCCCCSGYFNIVPSSVSSIYNRYLAYTLHLQKISSTQSTSTVSSIYSRYLAYSLHIQSVSNIYNSTVDIQHFTSTVFSIYNLQSTASLKSLYNLDL